MMKKIMLVTVSVVLCLSILTGCNFVFPWEPASGYSPEKPIPFGEYASIYTGGDKFQLKIIEIITEEDIDPLLDIEDNFVIVKFNVKVDKIGSSNFSLYKTSMLLSSGLSQEDIYLGREREFEEIVGIKNYKNIEFGAPGSVDCFAIFDVDSSDCQCLLYTKSYGEASIYFALS